jgi:fused signal recognition particle receptor
MGFFDRLKIGLQKTRAQIAGIVGISKFDEAFYDSVEEALIAADMGFDRSVDVTARLKREIRSRTVTTASGAYALLKELVVSDLASLRAEPVITSSPHVILVVGVNGVGKTTTIGKLCHSFRKQHKKVILGAADTFRAGAIEQLKIWADRTDAEFISQQSGSDPASVAYDALAAARARGSDILILDTAGRLHNTVNLMNELEKIVRVLKREDATIPHEVLLVIDATTGQNALTQARVFNEMVKLTGLVVTKLDGTAKGGIVVSIAADLNIPIRKIGVGEGIEDLDDFDPKSYVEAMFGDLPQT